MTHTCHNTIRYLAELGVGQSAIIAQTAESTNTGNRLREMGFTPGTEIRLVRCGPGGCPMQFSVRGTQLLMRADDARHVFIQSTRAA